jgi:glycosyltransferase involved in cell wall biosynthesis
VVVTLHDLYPYDIPANFGYPKVLINRLILQQCLRAADAIACVSDSTLHRLELYAPDTVLIKAVTIHNCVSPGRPMAEVSPLPGWQGEPFLLCVAQHRRNKNVLLAMQVFQQLLESGDLPHTACLLIVGAEGPETPTIERFIHDSGLAGNIILLIGISDSELEWCYGHCELLLAPSAIEGFGLPVVEAMLHHCRVVCSDISAFREVGGSYCQYVSLHGDPIPAFVAATRDALSSHRFRVAATDNYSAARISKAYMSLYGRLLQSDAIPIPPAEFNPASGLERGRT